MQATIVLVWAVKQHTQVSGIEAIIGLIAGVVVIFVALLSRTKEFVWKGGVPCCPQCGRQVSLKASRPNCRSCGANLMTGKPLLDLSPPPPDPEGVRRERIAHQAREEEAARRIEERRRRIAKAEAQANERRRERDERRKATIAENGGYTDLQLYGVGALIVLVPAGLATGLYFLL